jgi:parallel beta-helix repeat protein
MTHYVIVRRLFAIFFMIMIAVPSGILILGDMHYTQDINSSLQYRAAGDIPHATIYIDEDADFETLGFPGDGTPGNPYLIENYVIDGTATEDCIYVTAATVHFIIRNCTFRGDPGSGKAGVHLHLVGTAQIQNNTAFDCGAGITLNYSDNNTLSGNYFYNNSNGIYLSFSENNTIEDNTCFSNENAGLHLHRGGSNRILSNNLTMNEGQDIRTYHSHDNNVTGNVCGGGDSKTGMFWDESHRNRIEDNLVKDCVNGITIYWSDQDTIRNNTVRGCNSGIWLRSYTYMTEVTQNTCYNNTMGVTLTTSYHNYVLENNCSENGIGITFGDEARYNTVYDNYCRNNSKGISLSWKTYRNNLTENYCVDNEIGIHVDDTSHDNIIDSNWCVDNIEGIRLTGPTHHNNVTNNFCEDNEVGIVLLNDLVNNTVSGNNFTLDDIGISFNHTTQDNIVTDNLIDRCELGVFMNNTDSAALEVNMITNCDLGLQVGVSSNDSMVRWNTLVDNTASANDDGNGNLFNYNFWSDYAGSDSDADGIGDVPHPIPGAASNEDPLPAVYHPTRPTWAVSLGPVFKEAGYPFEYDLNVTSAAPISHWEIADSVNFAIDNDGVVTDSMPLDLGQYTTRVWAVNIYGVNLTGTFTVHVRDTIAPTVDHPPDITFSEDPVDWTVGRINWTPSDMTDLEYEIFTNDYRDDWGSWSPGDGPIAIEVSYLSEGIHNVTLVLVDEGGNTATDTVIVTVTEYVEPITTTTTTTTTSIVPPPDPILYIGLAISGLAAIIIIFMLRRR